MPALLTTMSIGPERAGSSRSQACTAVRSASSRTCPVTERPFPANERATSMTAEERPVMMVLIPASANRRAMASPMPLVPPVTRAVLSLAISAPRIQHDLEDAVLSSIEESICLASFGQAHAVGAHLRQCRAVEPAAFQFAHEGRHLSLH